MADIDAPLLPRVPEEEDWDDDNNHDGDSIGGSERNQNDGEQPTVTSKKQLLHEAERFITFTDAVVAIAMTLLILPLMEAAADMGEHSEVTTAADYFRHNAEKLWSLVLSFWMISYFWNGHDHIFQYVGRFTYWLTRCNFAWMAGIVFFPVATSVMMMTPDDDAIGTIAYLGTLMFVAFMNLVMCIVVRNDERTWKRNKPPGLMVVVISGILVLVLAVAMVVAVFAPNVGVNALLLVLAVRPISLIVKWAKPGLTY